MKIITTSLFLILLTTGINATNPYTMSLSEARDYIKTHNLTWTAGITNYSYLPEDVLRGLLREKASGFTDTRTYSIRRAGRLPASIDWTNHNGINWMTPVRDQGVCSSCWAFASLGLLEALVNISSNDPEIDPDLSEQFLISCSTNGDCSGGDAFGSANYVLINGVPDEDCFPYQARNAGCSEACEDWANRLRFYRSVSLICLTPEIDKIKAALSSAPVASSVDMSVLQLRFYKSGIMRDVKTTGLALTNHALVIVGYDDDRQAFKVKNSWGTSWGEAGYGWIAYNAQEIGTRGFTGTGNDESRIVVLSPNGGEDLHSGSTFKVKWTSPKDSRSFKIELTTNGGKSFETLDSIGFSRGYSWNIPYINSRDCKIRIRSEASTDESDACFSVTCQHNGSVNGVDISLDDAYAVSVGSDSLINYWKVANGSLITSIRNNSSLNAVQMWLPDNELAMTGDDGGVLNVWWLPDGSSVAGMTAHKMPIRSVAFNITGFYILSGSFDKSLKLFSNTYGEFPYKMLHDGAVNSVTFAPYSIYALSASEDKTIKYWNMENGLNLATFTGHTRGVTQVAYMPNARAAVSSSRDSTIKAWDLASGRCRRTIEVTSQANCITPSSDGRLVATGLEDGSIKIYENVNGSLFQSLYGHNAGVNSIKFSHSNNYIISGSRDRTVRYFHISSGTSRILGAAIRITSPKEGETWLPATYREVKWEFLAVDSLFIDLSTNAGSDWTRLAMLDAKSGVYGFTLPDVKSDSCMIRVYSTCFDAIPTDTVLFRIGDTGFRQSIQNRFMVRVFRVSPVPFRDVLHLSLPKPARVYAITGQLIMSLKAGSYELDTKPWHTGVYVIRCGKEIKRIVKLQ